MERTMAHQSSHNPSCRECMYLVQSRTGIYSFRWNISNSGTYCNGQLESFTDWYGLKILDISNLTP